MNKTMTVRQQAERRIADDPQLGMYVDILLYDWPEGDEHWRWVASAPIAELLEWCSGIRRDEQQEEEDRIQYHDQILDERILSHGG